MRWDAVVLSGGTSRRMGGRDKTAEYVGQLTLLDRVLSAVAGDRSVVVVGPERQTATPVTWTREPVPGSGPVAAVAAGLELVTAPLVVLLAADLPFVTSDAIGQLLGAIEEDGALAVDGDDRDQYLLSAWRTDALRAACEGVDRMSRVVERLRVQRVRLSGSPAPWTDCDTEDDLVRARAVQ